MSRVRLHNDDWGYETNCFVCEQRNNEGLRVPFFHDTERDVVEAHLRLGDAYSGAPTLLHGGVQLAVLDEAMAWATIAVGGQWALTQRSSAEFHGPVSVDVEYSVVAEIVDQTADAIETKAEIRDATGTVMTSATAVFVPVGEAVAIRLLGEAPRSEHADFMRKDD